jgi:AraC-like DNA-binding protein
MTPLVASSMALRARLDALRTMGLDVDAICRGAAIDEHSLTNPDHFLSESTIWAIWRIASAQYGGSALGLRAGANVPFGAYGVLDYLALTATTLGEGFRLLVLYWPLVGTGKRVEIAKGPGGCHQFRFTAHAGLSEPGLHCRDYSLAVITKHVLAQSGLRPTAVELAGPALGPVEEYAEVLGVPPSFDHLQTALVFSDREWYAELPGSDPPLVLTLEEHAANLVRRLPRKHGMVGLVQREMAARLSDRAVNLHAIARSLGTSERSLQRHVSLEGYTFEGLHDVARREAASELLKDPSLSIAEIAYLVGYSTPAAFHRAFKRWTGSTPRRVRTPTRALLQR